MSNSRLIDEPNMNSEVASASHSSLISVLIPAWNEADRIAACVDSLLTNGSLNIEVLICAGGDDETFAVASMIDDPRVSVIEQLPGTGKQRSLELLFTRSNGDFVFLTDADCVIPDHVLPAMINTLVEERQDVVAGTYQPFERDLGQPLVVYRWAIQRADERRRDMWIEGFSGANVLLTRNAIVRAGSFCEDAPTGTDYHLARSLRNIGIPIRYLDVSVQTEYALDTGTYLRRQSRWLRNTLVLGLKFNDRAEVIGTAKTIGLSCAVLVAPILWPIARIRIGLVWLYLVVTMIRRRRTYIFDLLNEHPGRGISFPTERLPLYCLLDSVAGAMPLIDLARRKSRWRW